MSRDREYIVAGIEALLVRARADVKRLEGELRRRAPKAVTAAAPKQFVRSAKARANMRKAQLARFAKAAKK